MSIQILLESESKNNKSLDLYCNSIDTNNINTVAINGVTIDNTPLENIKSVSLATLNESRYAVSPYLFCNNTIQAYSINATPKVISGQGTSSAGSSSAIFPKIDNTLYNFEVIGGATALGACVDFKVTLVINGSPVIFCVADLPVMNSNTYMCIKGCFYVISAGILCCKLSLEYQNSQNVKKEVLFTTTKVSGVPFVLGTINSYTITLESPPQQCDFVRIIGTFGCSYSDLLQSQI